MKKTLDNIITEALNKLVLEATREDFSLSKMDAMQDSYLRYVYCQSCLGEEIGEGSSRTVFLLSDEHVLKIAHGHSSYSGAAQNKVEWEISHSNVPYSDLFPRVYQHADDFSWIISEHVVEASVVDFHKVLGIPFEDTDENSNIHYIYDKIPIEDDGKYAVKDDMSGEETRELRYWHVHDYRDYEKYGYPIKNDDDKEAITFCDFVGWASKSPAIRRRKFYDKYRSLMLPSNPNYKWFREIYAYSESNNGWTDFDISNLGLAMRNGKPTIVLLDSGYNEDIARKYY